MPAREDDRKYFDKNPNSLLGQGTAMGDWGCKGKLSSTTETTYPGV
jgi:hypothetical protein